MEVLKVKHKCLECKAEFPVVRVDIFIRPEHCPFCSSENVEMCEDDYTEKINLKKGDKLRRIGDGKSFTYSSESDDIGYFHVEEMLVPVKLSDFEKEE